MNANDLFKAVFELDLDPIKVKLMHVESGEGWSKEKVNLVEKEYRRFLCLMKIYPNEATAPLEDVDTFWHYHILDTLKYADDCDRVFGRFLHHYPYVGMRGPGDEQFRIESGERMRTLYESTFAEAYPSSAVHLNGSGARMAFCGGPDSKKPGHADILSGNLAFCGGPDDKKLNNRTPIIFGKTAFCGGPDIRRADSRTAIAAPRATQTA